MVRFMSARTMVLCAGFGTRLRPLTNERPKPLVPVGDRTLLEHVLDGLEPQGLLPAVANAHHLSEIFRVMTRGWPQIARVLYELQIRGTAGGVAWARDLLGPAPVLVVNGDVLASYDAKTALERTPAEGMCLLVAPRPLGAGTVGIGAHGRVVRLRGERFGVETASGDYLCAMGLGQGVLDSLPEEGCLIGDVALPLLRRGGRVQAFLGHANWSAPGDGIGDYLDANFAWLTRRGARAGEAWVGPDAHVAESVELVSSVVGAGADVRGEGRLERVVVWPGAQAFAPLRDAVVTRSGLVVPRETA
jgi:mannose-1-phosphate guanylyltransferase